MGLPEGVLFSAIIIFVTSAAYYLLRDAGLLLKNSIVYLRLENQYVSVMTREGETWSGKILHDSFVTPALTILNVLPQGAHFSRSIIIFPDSLDKDLYRKLRVWLKWAH